MTRRCTVLGIDGQGSGHWSLPQCRRAQGTTFCKKSLYLKGTNMQHSGQMGQNIQK